MNVAELFPVREVREIIELDLISIAVAKPDDHAMHHLFVLWKMYVEPGLQATCNLCYSRVLKNYKGIQPEFIRIIKEDNLLNVLD
jgi:hypothetical protein